MSSRNQYLSPDERRVAVEIIRNLRTLRDQTALGLPPAGLEQEAVERLTAAGFEVDYVAIRRADLSIPDGGSEPGLLGLVAARLGRTRLIDNLDFDGVDAR
jgi:pantoate--beta-alanine ligase